MQLTPTITGHPPELPPVPPRDLAARRRQPPRHLHLPPPGPSTHTRKKRSTDNRLSWERRPGPPTHTTTIITQAHPARTCILNLWASLSEPNKPTTIPSPTVGTTRLHSQLLLHPDHARSTDLTAPPRPSQPAALTEGNNRLAALRYSLITLAFLCGALLVALLVRDLSLVLEVVGSTGSTIVSYLLPGATYARLHTWPHARRGLARAQFALGLVVIPVGLTSVFLKAG